MHHAMPAFVAGLLILPTAAMAMPSPTPRSTSKTAPKGPSPSATKAPADAVDALVKAQMARHKAPGVQVAVLRNGKVVLSRAYGMADLEHAVPTRTSDLFEIGSITKQFTATAVMMLVEQGKIDLDAPAERYLKTIPEAWKAVTVRNLLTHTSGIPNYTSEPDFSFSREFSPEEILALVNAKPLEFAPGERMSYSNTNYYLLGQIIGAVSGEPYREFLTARVLRPAGMARARLSGAEVIPNRARGYIPDAKGMLNAPIVLPDTAGAAGALLSSVEDMAKWDAALYTEKLIKNASLRQMWTPTRLNDGTTSPYAFGWEVKEEKGRRIVSHGGGTAGFSSMITRIAPENVTVIVLANAGGGAASFISEQVIGHYVPALKPAPPAVPPATDPDPARTARVKGIVLNLLSDKPDLSPFTAEMKAALTPQMLSAVRGQMGALGTLKSLAYLRDQDTPQGHVYQYRAVFGDTPLVAVATFTSDEQVSGLFMRPE